MNMDMNRALFGHLMMSLAQSALLGMGKIVHPVTGKPEMDLEGAQQSIDMLEMLKARTRGNLDAEEDRALTQTISMLQLNFVETAQAQPAAPAGESAPSAAPEIAPPATDAGAAKSDDEKVKFRKSYG